MAGSKRETPQRRTQAERRAATRLAVLDAAIDCLVEHGYARTTTRRIAQRAGVTQGALQHHFSSKTNLLGETIAHMRSRWAAALLDDRPAAALALRERHEQLLDRMWQLYRGPLFQAFLELAVAARTDPALRECIVGAHEEMTHWNEIGAKLLYPEFAHRAELIPLIVTGQATMRGLVLTGLSGEADADECWPTTRKHLQTLSAEVLDSPDLAP